METVRKRNTVCTPERIPSAAIETEAKRFAPSANLLTVYVVRGRWVDAVSFVSFQVDDRSPIATLPRSMARLRLEPGTHTLALTWNGTTHRLAVKGQAGDVVFVELAGAALPWEEPYHWSTADPAGSRERALRSRLIADVGP